MSMNANTKKRILIAVTSHDSLGTTGHKTGLWFEELAAPYYIFEQAGFDPVLVSPMGGRPPVDPGSSSPQFRTPDVDRFEADTRASGRLSATVVAETLEGTGEFAAIFLVGGHGTMWDFPSWKGLSKILSHAVSRKLPVAAVCHGLAGLLSLTEMDDFPLVQGKRMTGFTNAEEAAVGLGGVVPFLLEDKLRSAGAEFITADPFTPHVITDGLLITGQNPASSRGAAEALVKLIALT